MSETDRTAELRGVSKQQAIAHKLDVWRQAVRQHLLNPKIDAEPAYLIEPLKYALNTKGKMLRPALCLAAAEAVGGKWQHAVMLGAALEIFHTFTLVHDDIMDGDELRRGVPTVHAAYDSNRALLSGDTMLIYVYQMLAGMDNDKFPAIFKAFNAGAMDVCRGQGWDMQFEHSTAVMPQQYELMIDLKTGALLKLACELGALVGGADQPTIQALARFGLLLGRAFQMQDDLLELTSSTATMGKSLGSDVLNGKKTWIWLDLQKKLSPDERATWNTIQQSGVLGDAERQLVLGWMTQYGTQAEANRLVQAWIKEADHILLSAGLQDPGTLEVLADIILKRKN